MSERDPIIDEAFEKAGSASELARKLGVTPSAVLQWDKIPPSRALGVEAATGISRHRLRPDVYGPEPILPSSMEAAE
jgi:DNA-binding transcriptional regulator YdaS (Cro superfamily)